MVQESKRMYEGMFLVDSASATSNWDDVESELQRVFDRADAEVLSLRKWDDRRLCYDISGHKRGTYILTYFNIDPDRISGIERDVKLNEKLLRVLILRADCIPEAIREAPTPFMMHTKSASESVKEEDSLENSDVEEEVEPSAGQDEGVSEIELSDTKESTASSKAVEAKASEPVETESSSELKQSEVKPIQEESS